ncbi:LOW QUALITY PROTEIN: uncharacterized protein [Argopecten irradians]|uniref:LOW QUALITY PROTEIN: uncharacterized protein n=1 Tax=Argopecten irradians TaxID=31199 RepID=UPI00371CE97E
MLFLIQCSIHIKLEFVSLKFHSQNYTFKMADMWERHHGRSWILYHVLNRFIGSQEIVAIRRKLIVTEELIYNQRSVCLEAFSTGSVAEGMAMEGSDIDLMLWDKEVEVVCWTTSLQAIYRDKTVFIMRNADSRPGYAKLEVCRLATRVHKHLIESIVPVGTSQFISSEIFTRCDKDEMSDHFQLQTEVHGPACTILYDHPKTEADYVKSFQCYSWPTEADEWVIRPRLQWPDPALRDHILQSGCHLVPVGDKTSSDTFLQWRISFATAERKLMYSLTHIQFLVYGLLKYFLKQISGSMKQLFGDSAILSSYTIKTVLFHALENTLNSFWQEKNIFFCFMFCLEILLSWVKTGYCPNYFIRRNNMFQGKIHSENQGKILRFLTNLYDLNWGCLSFGTFIQPSIKERVDRVENATWGYVLPTSTLLECERDEASIVGTFTYEFTHAEYYQKTLLSALILLCKSKSDIEEFIAYTVTSTATCHVGMNTFCEQVSVRGNKEKYKYLMKSRRLLIPYASLSSPCQLATYYYLTGNYSNALDICGYAISSFKIYALAFRNKDVYEQHYCGRGYTLLQKYKMACVSDVIFSGTASQFCTPQLRQEIMKSGGQVGVPPLPYAAFLSFLCYHELCDTKRRDAATRCLRVAKYAQGQDGSPNWIVHNLLGICYEIAGDRNRAIREYRNSMSSVAFDQFVNPARERIERVQQF